LRPSPIQKVERLLKASSASLSPRSGKPYQGLSGSVRLSQYHLIRRASPCNRRHFMPSPPTSFGLHIDSQATKHCPPLTLSFPAQKKAHIHLFISSKSHFGASATTN
jgi:hypothetical protein